MDKRIVRVAIGNTILTVANRPALDTFPVDRARYNDIFMQTGQKRLNVNVKVIGVLQREMWRVLLLCLTGCVP